MAKMLRLIEVTVLLKRMIEIILCYGYVWYIMLHFEKHRGDWPSVVILECLTNTMNRIGLNIVYQ